MAKDVRVAILGDSKDFQRAIKDAQQSAETFGDKAGKIGKSVTVAFAAVGAGAVLVGSKFVSAASDLAETQSKVAVIFGDSADKVEEFGKSAATALGQSKKQAMDAAATFATFGKSAGLSGQELVDFSTDFTALASDMASFSNTSPEEAITAIGAALRGESEPIRQYGVLLDDATLRNAAFKLGLIETTTQALTPQQKVLAAQAEIMRQTTDAQGDFERTSGGLANQQRILKAELENVAAAIGTKLLPIGLALVSWIREEFIPAFKDMIQWMKDHKEIVIAASVAIGTVLVAAFIAWGVAAAQAAVATVIATWPILAITAAVAALAAGLTYAYRNSETFRNVVDSVGRVLRDDVWPVLKTVGEYIAKDLKLQFEIASKAVGLLADGFRFAKGVIEGIIDKIKGLLDLLGKIPGAVDKALGPLDEIVGGAAGAAGKIGGAIGKLNPFADGGVVGGSVGSPQPILAHGGEMVLNPSQQAALFASLNGGGGGSSTINLVVDGRVLASAVRNADRRLM